MKSKSNIKMLYSILTVLSFVYNCIFSQAFQEKYQEKKSWQRKPDWELHEVSWVMIEQTMSNIIFLWVGVCAVRLQFLRLCPCLKCFLTQWTVNGPALRWGETTHVDLRGGYKVTWRRQSVSQSSSCWPANGISQLSPHVTTCYFTHNIISTLKVTG